jgi:DNA mismatch endonuclease (patch repair protein)
MIMDIWTKEKRSEVMSRIRGKNTKPETILRSHLFRNGFRFRLHRSDLPGKPDIVLPKYKAVIFVHGCFWHYHQDCKEGRIPSSNSSFWKAKLGGNIKRDKKNLDLLQRKGWKTIVVWECEIEKDLDHISNKVIKMLVSSYVL